MATALKEAKRQADNPLYERDLVDLARRYLGDLFNGLVPEILHAWRAGDERRFDRAARGMQRLMDCIEGVLWASPQYRLDTHFTKAQGRPGGAELPVQTRNILSIWEGRDDLLDYVRRDDFAELVTGYYRPRVETWLNWLDGVAPEEWGKIHDDRIKQLCRHAGEEFVKHSAKRPEYAEFDHVAVAIEKALAVGRKLERYGPKANRQLRNLDFRAGWDGWDLSARSMYLSFRPGEERGLRDELHFESWPGVGGGNMYLSQTVRARDAEISLDFKVDTWGESGFAGLRVEAYDAAFKRVAECTYQAGDAWNYWPDRYRPDNVTPEWSVGATPFFWWWVGHYAIKERLDARPGEWVHVDARPARDMDRIHGTGTWESLNVAALRIALVASRRREEDPIAGAFTDLDVKLIRK